MQDWNPSPMSLKAGLGGDIVNFLIACAAFLGIGYAAASFILSKWRFATPGLSGNEETSASPSPQHGKSSPEAERIIALLGGRDNITLVDACMTRLRVTVKDAAKVAGQDAWKAEGAVSLLVSGNGVQAVYGPRADVLKSDINDLL